ncbi:nuclear transport factor 2 family protein [Pseudomonas sp. UL073]|uniref:Nuclear transport factor 2 family protein n=1 Tax=Zestomonas insulae TaxID=2809017 RepID=A0ABS2IKJ6_9GAMM|nr:nuclear transport factor 2 family protein [Pseudomonas insulae]MBM7062894.1 nuclear transport factor 2 family protein [Pseudomonas insulae]
MTTRDLSSISATVHEYFEGMYHGDTTRLRHAFHPQAYLFGYFHGALCHDSLENWMEEVDGTPVPAKHGEPFDMRIVSVDVTPPVAVAKVDVLYLGLRFTDYLSLLQIDDRWQIVNKIYRHA